MPCTPLSLRLLCPPDQSKLGVEIDAAHVAALQNERGLREAPAQAGTALLVCAPASAAAAVVIRARVPRRASSYSVSSLLLDVSSRRCPRIETSPCCVRIRQIAGGQRRMMLTSLLLTSRSFSLPSSISFHCSLFSSPPHKKKRQQNVRDALAPRHPRGPRRLGHRHRDPARPRLGRRPLRVARQVRDRLEPDARGGRGLRPPAPRAARPLALCAGRRHLLRRPVRALGLLGRHAAALGPDHGRDDAPLPGAHQGRAVGGLLGRQQADRLGLAR